MRFTVKRIFHFLLFDRCAGDGGAGFFNGVDHFGGGLADTVQRGFQLRRFLVLAPAGHIGEGII